MPSNNLSASHAAAALGGWPRGCHEKTKCTGALYGLRPPMINAAAPVCRGLIGADREIDPGVSRGLSPENSLSDRDRMVFGFLGIRQFRA